MDALPPMPEKRSIGCVRRRALAAMAATRLALVALFALRSPSYSPGSAAQTLTNTFGGLTKNSDQPIDIEFDVLVVHDKQKYATFKGNVKAVQGIDHAPRQGARRPLRGRRR